MGKFLGGKGKGDLPKGRGKGHFGEEKGDVSRKKIAEGIGIGREIN